MESQRWVTGSFLEKVLSVLRPQTTEEPAAKGLAVRRRQRWTALCVEGRGQAKSKMQGCVVGYNISVNKTIESLLSQPTSIFGTSYLHTDCSQGSLSAFYRLTHVTLTVSLRESTLFSHFKRGNRHKDIRDYTRLQSSEVVDLRLTHRCLAPGILASLAPAFCKFKNFLQGSKR